MFSKRIDEQLKEFLPDLPMIIGEASLRHDLDDLILLALPVKNFAVVDDVNTQVTFGNKIYSALKGRFSCEHITLADGVQADDEAVNHIRKKTGKCDAIIAVGSGTINDLCKYAAHQDGKPYIVFPTAASMNGYLSASASITIKNHKTTLPAILPKAVFCDFSIIGNAPPRLRKSGLGDSLARPTSQADWLLSYLLLNTKYDQRPFELLADIEAELFDNAGGIAKNDPQTIGILMKLLLLSGLGMTIAGGSYPASQGEHMIAHAYNMLKTNRNNIKTKGEFHALHGEEIGITTLYMARLQEKLLTGKAKFRTDKFDKSYIANLFGEELAGEFEQAFEKKLALINNAPPIKWDEIKEQISKIMIPPSQIENILKKSESAMTIESIGWNEQDFTTACATACFTRDRFTFLDIVK